MPRAFALLPWQARADTVASPLGNYTIDRYRGFDIDARRVHLHYVVVFGHLRLSGAADQVAGFTWRCGRPPTPCLCVWPGFLYAIDRDFRCG